MANPTTEVIIRVGVYVVLHSAFALWLCFLPNRGRCFRMWFLADAASS